MGDDIDAVVEEVIVDAYGDDEQLWAFRQSFEVTAPDGRHWVTYPGAATRLC